MKVAIDTGPLESEHKIRGVGIYTRELIKALGNKVEAVDFQSTDLARYDVIHFPTFNPFFKSFKLILGVKVVVTIHDLIPLIYPSHYPPGLKGSIRFNLQKYSIKKVDAIITDTETSKKDICRFLGVNPKKVHVIYLASPLLCGPIKNLGEIKERYGLPDKFALYVGDVNYNKNIPNLVTACKLARTPLVICGKQALEIEKQDLNHPELAHLKNVDFKDVLRLGFVPDEDMVGIYKLASVYVQPSFYEGFGLPVLQAFECRTPIVAAKTQALVEIAEGAATFVDPYNPKKIADGFKHSVKNPKLPREYLWKNTAKETLAVYNEVYEDK